MQWALDVPMFFVLHDARYRPANGLQLPPLPRAKVTRASARRSSDFEPPPHHALPRRPAEAVPRGARRRRRAGRADLRAARALEGAPLRRGRVRTPPGELVAGWSLRRARGVARGGGASRPRGARRRPPGAAARARAGRDRARRACARIGDGQAGETRRAWLPRPGAGRSSSAAGARRRGARALGRRLATAHQNA